MSRGVTRPFCVSPDSSSSTVAYWEIGAERSPTHSTEWRSKASGLCSNVTGKLLPRSCPLKSWNFSKTSKTGSIWKPSGPPAKNLGRSPTRRCPPEGGARVGGTIPPRLQAVRRTRLLGASKGPSEAARQTTDLPPRHPTSAWREGAHRGAGRLPSSCRGLPRSLRGSRRRVDRSRRPEGRAPPGGISVRPGRPVPTPLRQHRPFCVSTDPSASAPTLLRQHRPFIVRTDPSASAPTLLR